MKRKIDRVYVLCCAADLWLAKLCVASIRYWYPQHPITLLKDLTCGAFETGDLEHHWNVDRLVLPNSQCGAGFAKIELLLRPAKERFLILDADTIICGKVLELLESSSGDFIVSKRTEKNPG